MNTYELGFVGAGNMAEAIVRGILNAGELQASQIVMSDPIAQRCEMLSGELGVSCVTENRIPASCRRVVLAVKPQMTGEVLDGIAESVQDETLVVSIVAGLSTAFFDDRLGGKGHIVRVMPNTPILVGEGMSALAAGPRASDEDLQWAQKLFSASGKTVIVDESQIDAVTAVSGSGPAYFFYLIEAMAKAGVAEGLTSEEATTLAVQTCLGAGRLLQQTGEAPEVLRARVTSPGGTTQRAIETMEQAKVGDSLVRAVRAAAERSRELAG